jgi:arylsulfatase
VADAAPANRPNIVVILADDMGYSDLGCYGGEVQTPNIDALAQNGLRFTQFYNVGRCCPTRASLLTGLYPHQAGVGRMTNDAKLPGYRGRLNENCVTIAEVLRSTGYRTAMVGKWHLSNTTEGPDHMRHLNNQAIAPQFGDPKTYPVGRGFEEHYGIIWGVANFFDPFSLVHNAEPVREVPKDFYLTDAISDHAVEYIDKYGKGAEPLFMYVAYTAPHWPLQAIESDIKKYEDTFKDGWDAVRTRRFERMKKLGVLSPGAKAGMAPRNEPNAKWEDDPTREWDARAMAVHAAMIDRMDQGVGRIVARLRDRKMLDNTLILVLSDNGASPETIGDPGFDRPSQTRDGRKIAYPPDKTVMPGPETTFFGFGPQWANVSNTPLRLWKAEMFEGGISTPLVVHWPGGLKTKTGGITHGVGHVMDVMATCLDVAGATYPREFEGRMITPMEGQSLAPLLRGEAWQEHKNIGWEHIGARALRKGDWKIVSRRKGDWALYDLAKDRAESHDLSAEEPERLKSMSELWERWAKRVNVYPAPN